MKINTAFIKRSISSLMLMVAFFLGSITLAPVAYGDAYGDCGGVKTAVLSCPDSFNGQGGIEKSGVMGILTVVVNIMAAAVGILAIGAFVYAGIVYASAADSQEKVKQARGIIFNTVIGLVLFVALYALVNFIVPGGVL